MHRRSRSTSATSRGTKKGSAELKDSPNTLLAPRSGSTKLKAMKTFIELADDTLLLALHQVVFGENGPKNWRKRKLKSYSGLKPDEKDSVEFRLREVPLGKLKAMFGAFFADDQPPPRRGRIERRILSALEDNSKNREKSKGTRTDTDKKTRKPKAKSVRAPRKQTTPIRSSKRSKGEAKLDVIDGMNDDIEEDGEEEDGVEEKGEDSPVVRNTRRKAFQKLKMSPSAKRLVSRRNKKKNFAESTKSPGKQKSTESLAQKKRSAVKKRAEKKKAEKQKAQKERAEKDAEKEKVEKSRAKNREIQRTREKGRKRREPAVTRRSNSRQENVKKPASRRGRSGRRRKALEAEEIGDNDDNDDDEEVSNKKDRLSSDLGVAWEVTSPKRRRRTVDKFVYYDFYKDPTRPSKKDKMISILESDDDNDDNGGDDDDDDDGDYDDDSGNIDNGGEETELVDFEQATLPPRKEGGGRLKWTPVEVQALVEGVTQYGVGKWNEILLDNIRVFEGRRTGPQLKDKWRSILQQKEVAKIPKPPKFKKERPSRKSADAFSKERRQRIPWSKREVKLLQKLILDAPNGVPSWKDILKKGEGVFHPSRRNTDLKDKWRNLTGRKLRDKPKKRFHLLNSKSMSFNNKFPRDAALKAASRGFTNIALLEDGTETVHCFEGTREKTDAPSLDKFNRTSEIWVPAVKKTAMKTLDEYKSKPFKVHEPDGPKNRGGKPKASEEPSSSSRSSRRLSPKRRSRRKRKGKTNEDDDIGTFESPTKIAKKTKKKRHRVSFETNNENDQKLVNVFDDPPRAYGAGLKKRSLKSPRKSSPKRRQKKKTKDVPVDELLSDYYFLTTKLEEPQTSKLVESLGGKMIRSLIEASRLSNKGAKILVLADRTRTTKKFLFSLSRGLAPLKPGWLQECRRLGEITDAIPYTIPFGVPLFREPPLPPPCNWVSLLNRQGLLPVPREERVLHGLEIGLVSESQSFADNVSVVIEEAGATVVKASKSSMAQNLYCVVCEKTVKRLPHKYPCEVVEFAWVVECVQTQKRVPFAKKGYYDFTDF